MQFSEDGTLVRMRPNGAWHRMDGSVGVKVIRYNSPSLTVHQKGKGTPVPQPRKGKDMRGRRRARRSSN